MVVQLATVKQERNVTILKVIEKDGVLKRLSEQLQSTYRTLVLSCCLLLLLLLEPSVTPCSCLFFRGPSRAGASWASQEQDASVLNQAHEAQHKLEAIAKKAIGDIAKLGRVMISATAALGVSLGPRTPKTLIEEVGRLPCMVQELELSTARRAVHRILAMIESHYLGLDRMALSGGWAPGISDDQCDELEVDCATFACEMADTSLKDLELLPQNESEAPGVPAPPS
jgi:hypothetical protein